MTNKEVDADETKRQKARSLRYRKAIAKDINFDRIQEDLWEIQEECDNVRYYFEEDDETLLNALDGDEDEESEFRMMFCDLSAECEQMQEDLQTEYVPDCFDDFFVAVGKGEELLGWDSYEGDYFGLGYAWEEKEAQKESRKRLLRLTKEQIIEAAQDCFSVFRAYIGLRHRYDCLKSAMDILKDENTGYRQMVRQINEAYEKAERDTHGFRYDWGESAEEFDGLISSMPDMAWIQ